MRALIIVPYLVACGASSAGQERWHWTVVYPRLGSWEVSSGTNAVVSLRGSAFRAELQGPDQFVYYVVQGTLAKDGKISAVVTVSSSDVEPLQVSGSMRRVTFESNDEVAKGAGISAQEMVELRGDELAFVGLIHPIRGGAD